MRHLRKWIFNYLFPETGLDSLVTDETVA